MVLLEFQENREDNCGPALSGDPAMAFTERLKRPQPWRRDSTKSNAQD